MAPAPDHDRDLAGLDRRAAHVELTDGEHVDHRDRVVRHVAGNGTRHHLGHDEELAEASLRLGVLSDHLGAAQPAVDEQDRHRGHARADRELVRAAGSVHEHLADELVTEHDVTVLVVHDPRLGPRGPRRGDP